MTKRNNPHRIIAIGASAGGIQALYSFFDHTPLDQVSYVVIQHLSSDHQSRLAELLKKHSKLQICVAENKMPVEANRVYVIPNKAYLTVREGKLQLTGKSSMGRPHMTIDTFFVSLAADQGAKAIGIILSGTGKDGSEGIQAIGRAGGWIMVQDPLTAQYDQMPRSAIATGWASTVLATEAMPGAIQAYVHPPSAGPASPLLEAGHPAPIAQNPISGPPVPLTDNGHHPAEEAHTTRPAYQLMNNNEIEMSNEPQESALMAILEFIKQELPLDFSDYKRPTVFRRIQRRMALQGLSSADAYLDYLKANPPELAALTKDFLISVTAFFRDARAFEIIEQKIIPAILARGSDPLKIWVAGCATGEEAYSLAMLVQECLEKTLQQREVKIFATDLDDAALAIASKGVYAASIAKTVPPGRLERFFTRQGEGFKVKDTIRRMLIFAHHDLAKNPPYCHVDLISCRNLLIYLNPALQKKVFSLLHFGLRQGGYLLLGSSERAPLQEVQFLEVNKKWRIYQKTAASPAIAFDAFSLPQPGEGQPLPLAGPNPASTPARQPVAFLPGNYLGDSVIKALLEHYRQVGVCLDENRRVVQAFGDLSPFLLSQGFNFNFNLVELLPQPLLVALGTAFNQAVQSKEPVAIGGIRNELDPTSTIHLLLKPFVAARTGQQLLLLLLGPDTPPPSGDQPSQPFEADRHTREYITFLEAELRENKESLQAAAEKQEAYSENMQSFNEELLSAGEEMQSGNEELQSVNEELQTINTEYQLKIRELTELNDDLNNYFRSNVSGQLFVDKDLLLKKFSPAAIQHINLRESDIGRPLHHITTNIRFETIVADIQEVIASGETITREVQATTGKWYQVMVMAYIRQADHQPVGAMVTFYDVTDLVEERQKVEESQQRALALAQALGVSNEELRRTNVDLDNFVYTASHDLRAPVNTLKGLLALLSKRLAGQADENTGQLLGMVNTSVAKLGRVMVDLTEIAKVQKDEGEKESILFRVLLEEVLAELEEPIRESGILISQRIESEQLHYPRKHLRSILYNLLSNAIKYRSSDRVAEVALTFRLLDENPVLVVADNGLGLKPEQLAKLFSIYKRFHNHVEGTGLGLYMIKRMVDNNGGHIEVTSQQGVGTTFTVHFTQL